MSGAVNLRSPCVCLDQRAADEDEEIGRERKVKKVATAPPATPAHSGDNASGPKICLVQPPTKPNRSRSLISGPGVVFASARPSIICVEREPARRSPRLLVHIGQHGVGAPKVSSAAW